MTLKMPDHGDQDRDAVDAALALTGRIKGARRAKGKAMKASHAPLAGPLAAPSPPEVDPRIPGLPSQVIIEP